MKKATQVAVSCPNAHQPSCESGWTKCRVLDSSTILASVSTRVGVIPTVVTMRTLGVYASPSLLLCQVCQGGACICMRLTASLLKNRVISVIYAFRVHLSCAQLYIV